MKKEELAILEFDPCQTAFIGAKDDFASQDISKITAKKAVICFFKDAIEKYVQENECEKIACFRSELIDLPLYLDKKRNILFIQGYVGSPCAAVQIELLQFLGAEDIITCGGAGVLTDLTIGHLMIPISAVRDEGTSFHYAPPSYEIAPSLPLTEKLIAALEKRNLPFVKGKTWTTDGAYRETKEKVKLRKAEGCICVEMECAAFYAVGQFKKVRVASILYSGDSLIGDEWNHRNWNTRANTRFQLFSTVMDICEHEI